MGSDIVERLRYHADDGGLDIGAAWSLLDESADEIERLRERVRELERAMDDVWVCAHTGYTQIEIMSKIETCRNNLEMTSGQPNRPA